MRDAVAAGLALAAALLLGATSTRAQSAPPWASAATLDQPSYLTPSPLRAQNPLTTRSRDYAGIPASDWLFYPDLLVGAAYNDNLSQAQTHRVGGLGARLQGEITGVRDVGPSRTTVFAGLDAYLYPGHTSDNVYNGRVGVAHVRELQPGFTVKAQVEYDQLSYLTFGGLVETPGGVATPLVSPQRYKQLRSSAAVQKSFGRFFLGVSLDETATSYDPLATAVGSLSQGYRNSLVTSLSERAGFWISPLLYGFAETSENWRQYVSDPFASHGYRAVAGLGSDRIGLYRGEIYAGYQEQVYQTTLLGSARSPVVGGRVFWYPTRAWTVSASLNESFSDANNPTPSNPMGDPAHVTAVQLSAEYQLGRRWSAQGFAEFDASRYLGVSRIDDTFITGLVVNREIARNFNVSVDYKYLDNRSNAEGSSYSNNIVGAAANYKF